MADDSDLAKRLASLQQGPDYTNRLNNLRGYDPSAASTPESDLWQRLAQLQGNEAPSQAATSHLSQPKRPHQPQTENGQIESLLTQLNEEIALDQNMPLDHSLAHATMDQSASQPPSSLDDMPFHELVASTQTALRKAQLGDVVTDEDRADVEQLLGHINSRNPKLVAQIRSSLKPPEPDDDDLDDMLDDEDEYDPAVAQMLAQVQDEIKLDKMWGTGGPTSSSQQDTSASGDVYGAYGGANISNAIKNARGAGDGPDSDDDEVRALVAQVADEIELEKKYGPPPTATKPPQPTNTTQSPDRTNQTTKKSQRKGRRGSDDDDDDDDDWNAYENLTDEENSDDEFVGRRKKKKRRWF